MILDKFGNPYEVINFGNVSEKNSYEKNSKTIIYSDMFNSDELKFVKWGDDNLEPQKLIFYSYRSPVLKGILNKEKVRIFGDELVFKGTNDILNEKHPMYYVSPGVTIHDFIKKLIDDFSTLSTYSFSVEYTKNLKKIANLYHIPVASIRSGKQNRTGNVNKYYMSNDWGSINSYNNIKPKSIKAFNPEKPGFSQLYYKKTNNLENYYYSDVSWKSSLDWVILDYEIAQYHMSDITNGMSPGLILSFHNEVDQSKAKKIKNKFISQYQGSENASKMVFLFSPTKDAAPEITQLERSKNDERFNTLKEQINEKIVLSTGIPRILSGLETTVGLSNGANVLYEAEKIWYKNEIKNKRQYILDGINDIMKLNGYPEIDIIDNTYNLFDMGLSDNIISNNFTQNEIRESLGFEPIKNNDKRND